MRKRLLSGLSKFWQWILVTAAGTLATYLLALTALPLSEHFQFLAYPGCLIKSEVDNVRAGIRLSGAIESLSEQASLQEEINEFIKMQNRHWDASREFLLKAEDAEEAYKYKSRQCRTAKLLPIF